MAIAGWVARECFAKVDVKYFAAENKDYHGGTEFTEKDKNKSIAAEAALALPWAPRHSYILYITRRERQKKAS